MNIVLWVGNEANQKALANKIHQMFPLAGIVTETRKNKKTFNVYKLTEKIIEKIFLRSIAKAWLGMKKHYDHLYPDYPQTKILNTDKINSDETYLFTKELNPDLIVVSGTSLIRKKLLSLQPSIGIINLHTGLSPYIKGGPNCTNWCIATNQFHLIGNTIMWIDAGIDTGNLIKTELTQFVGSESLEEVHIKVMEHAHDVYLKAIVDLSKGHRNNIPQHTIVEGKTYYTKEWGLKEKLSLVKNFRKFKTTIQSKAYHDSKNEIKIVG